VAHAEVLRWTPLKRDLNIQYVFLTDKNVLDVPHE
jgi:hypothetical protein